MPKTVTVGCKLPHGLHLDLGEKRVTLNGENSSEIIGGHGITHNVDKEHFDNWLALHHEHPAVKAGLIFAHEQAASVKDRAKDGAKVKHGFEPIDPDKPGNGVEKADLKS